MPKYDYAKHLRMAFTAAENEKRPAFVGYVTAGYPQKERFAETLVALQEGGADVIELGIPFSDPMADGPMIQLANQVALDNGVQHLEDSLVIVREARAAGVRVPIVLMGYFNPFRSYGEDKLMQDCVAAGVNGFIIVDLPPDESDLFRTKCRQHYLSFIPLIAPTTTPQRVKQLAQCADSFIYAVSLTGVTGARTTVSDTLPEFIKLIKSETNLPIAVGFGISTNEHFNHVGSIAHGVVVGSAIVKCLQTTTPDDRSEKVIQFCQSLTGRTKATIVDAPLINHAEPIQPILPSPRNEDPNAQFGAYGGRFVPETIVAALDELEREYAKAKVDPTFHEEVRSYWDYIGRPSRLHVAERLTEFAGGAQIWLKREDLNHTGAHKINNAIAQALLAKRLGKTRLIAETGAGADYLLLHII